MIKNNLCISIYTDGDFHLSDRSNNPIKNSLPYKYFIKINLLIYILIIGYSAEKFLSRMR